MTRTLHSSNILYQETENTALCENKMELEINYEQLLDAQKDANVLIIDVREPSEISETGVLPGSIHIPMNDVKNVLDNFSEKEFEEKYGKSKPTKDTKIIFSCRSGRRSASVQKTVQKLGYIQAYNYTGGWLNWQEESEKRK